LNHIAFLLQFVSCVNTWLHVVTTTTLLNTYARMTIHSYCSRQDKKIGESSFNSRRRTHHIKVVTFTISVHEHKCGSSTHLLLPSSSVRMREGGICHRPLACFVSLTHIIAPPPTGCAQDTTTTAPDQLASGPLPTCSWCRLGND